MWMSTDNLDVDNELKAWVNIVLCHNLLNWRYSQIAYLFFKKFHKFQKHIQSIEIMSHSLMFVQSALMLILTFCL